MLTLFGSLYAFQRGRRLPPGLTGSRVSEQYEWEMQDPVDDPPDARVDAEWTFGRLRYPDFSGGGGSGRFGRRRGRFSWGTDANKGDRQFVMGLRRLTRVNARSVEHIVDVNSDDMYGWPWLYAVEVGHWELNDAQARRMRDFFDRGGFLMVDDFHGLFEWEIFEASLRRIFPDREIVDLMDTDAIFHSVFDLSERFQVPGRQYLYSGRTWERDDDPVARWRGVIDPKGRIQVAICYNMDIGDALEWADHPEYPEKFASLAYRIGVNYVVYSMTH